jgi:hypothetical protein
MRPSVGRIVHYVSRGSADFKFPSVCRAAVVTEVHGDGAEADVSLAVLNPSGLFFDQEIPYAGVDPLASPPPGGTWHWPERVEE